jgi:hypothetical protein
VYVQVVPRICYYIFHFKIKYIIVNIHNIHYRPIGPMVKTEYFQYFNKGSNPLWVKKERGFSLIGKTMILHIVILGSSPEISNFINFKSIKLNL